MKMKKTTATVTFLGDGGKVTIPAYRYGPFLIHRAVSPKFPEPTPRHNWALSTAQGCLMVCVRGTRNGCKRTADELLESVPAELWKIHTKDKDPRELLRQFNILLKADRKVIGEILTRTRRWR